MTWSPGHVDVGIQSLLVQIYPVLLSTLLSINRQQLATVDVDFALLLSSSPLTIYLVVASISDICGIHTGLYKRIKSYRFIIRILGALVLLLWIGLGIIRVVSPKAFKDSSCFIGQHTFWNWAGYVCLTLLAFLVSPGLGFVTAGFGWLVLTPSFVCLVRRWSQLRADVKCHSEGASLLRVLLTWVKCAWCVPFNVGPRLVKSNAVKVHR